MRQSWLYEDVLQVLQGLKAKKGGLKALSLAPHIRRKAATLVPHLLCPRVPAPLTETLPKLSAPDPQAETCLLQSV